MPILPLAAMHNEPVDEGTRFSVPFLAVLKLILEEQLSPGDAVSKTVVRKAVESDIWNVNDPEQFLRKDNSQRDGFDIRPNVYRETLKSLAEFGLIETGRGITPHVRQVAPKKSRVSSFTQRVVSELFYVSRGIVNYANENPIAITAMRNLRSITVEIEQLASRYNTEKRADFFMLDLAAHLEIAKAAEASSHHLCAISRSFFESIIAWACSDCDTTPTPDDKPSQIHRIAGFHVTLADLILSGEMAGAMFVMRAHLLDCFAQDNREDAEGCERQLDIFCSQLGYSWNDECADQQMLARKMNSQVEGKIDEIFRLNNESSDTRSEAWSQWINSKTDD